MEGGEEQKEGEGRTEEPEPEDAEAGKSKHDNEDAPGAPSVRREAAGNLRQNVQQEIGAGDGSCAGGRYAEAVGYNGKKRIQRSLKWKLILTKSILLLQFRTTD